MKSLEEIRYTLRNEEWYLEPFQVLSEIANLCSSHIDLGREFVIRALEHRDFLSKGHGVILDKLAIQVGL